MSQGVMRKPQPFTVGTRLSIPKCPDLPTSGHRVAPMDSLCLPQNLHTRMLHRSPPPPGSTYGPHIADNEDVTPGPHKSLLRSIRRIALSRHAEPPHKDGATAPRTSFINSQGNFNNNNSRGLWQLGPDAICPPCDRMSGVQRGKSPTSPAKGPASPSSPPRSDHTAPPTGGVYSGGRRPSVDPPQLAQLSRDISEAEGWVREKLQDLGDQYDVCPQPGQEQSAPSIPGDIGSFEDAMMKLNQLSDHLSGSDAPNAAALRVQLQTLKGQWQLLKDTATNHSRVVGGTKELQEFNKKADELEMWMREKEEIPPLSLLLDENLDKVQLSRRILDLKQEQLYYSNLQENINSLAQKLEKHGRPESRSTSNRRKQLNRMWLRLQGSLDDYQRNLQLALEGASLWQQADTVMRAMQEKGEAAGEPELRDIAGQIMVLDVSVSQVCSLHPVLASRALHRQRQVKEIWSQLQQTVRTGKSSRGSTFTRERGNSVTPGTREQSSVGSRTIVSQVHDQRWRAPNPRESNVQIPPHPAPQTAPNRCGKLRQCREESDTMRNISSPSSDIEEDDFLSELRATSQWLQNLEQLLLEPAAMRSPELVRRDLKQVNYLEKQLKSRGAALHTAGRGVRSSGANVDDGIQVRVREVEERLQTVQEALHRRASDLRDTLVLSEFMKVVQMEEERRRRNMPLEEPPVSPTELAIRTEVFTPLEELQEAVEMLNDAAKERERALAATKEMTDLEGQLSVLSQRIHSASALTQDVWKKMEEVERDYMAVKKPAEMRDLQEVSAMSQRVEAEVLGEIQAAVRRMEEQRDRLQELCPHRSQGLGRSIEETLQAWAQLQEDVRRNQTRLHRTSRLREFFLSYLGMISWTEETRSQILSDSPEERLCPAWREGLERSIGTKMKEFEVLAGLGWKLIGEDRLLTQTIRERLEELQGMLSWVLMRWRCQKHARIMGKTPRSREAAGGAPAVEDAQHRPIGEDITSTAPPPRGPARRRYRRKALSPLLFQPPLGVSGGTDNEDGAELLEDAPGKCADGPLWLEPKVLPTGPGVEEQEEEEPLEVSIYLNTKEAADSSQCLTVPRPSKKSRSSDHHIFLSADDPTNRPNLLFRSLKRKEKSGRSAVPGATDSDTKGTTKYETSTWPPKIDRTSPPTNEMSAESGEELHPSNPVSAPTCPHLTLGSVLTLELPKEANQMANIQGSLRIVPAEHKGPPQRSGGATNTETEEPVKVGGPQDPQSSSYPSCTRSWIEALTSSSGYCRQNIHGYGKPEDNSLDLEELNDDFINFQINKLSPIGAPQESDWGPQTKDEMRNLFTAGYPENNPPSTGGKILGGPQKSAVQPHNDSRVNPEHSHVEFVRLCDERAGSANNSPNNKAAPHSFPEVLHPDQEFLENDDQELEDIWNNARKGQLENPKPTKGGQLPKTNQETPGRQVVMRAEPNILVATFTLPPPVVLSLNQREDESPTLPHTGDPKTSEPLRNNPEETSITSVTRKLDYQLMEGTLEKKPILQSGGRKASSRTWGVFYAVLVRRTLCFYHDRKHSTKSPGSAPPLHLTGATCTPESDYTKRSNCFRLRLRDGSEYLFRAPTFELLQDWVCKLRHNSGVEETDPLGDPGLAAERSPRLTSGGRPLNSCMPDLCQPIAVRGRDLAAPHLEPFSAPAGGCRADTHLTRLSDNRPESADSEFDVRTASRRRSRSFSSVIYQKMTSFPSTPERSPSYSVTLYIDDPLTPRPRCHSFASSNITNNVSDLKLRNKSVFRKLFWKKE